MNDLGSLGLLQAYRANPFSLQADMGRPAQLLPPGLGQFNYSPMFNQSQGMYGGPAQAPAPEMPAWQRALTGSLGGFSGSMSDADAGMAMGPADGGFDGADGGGGAGGK
jgi:hypothetical protein